ncbi:MAG: oligosaccharide flippase family protein [Ignavibacteriales bacterium]|nr:oligosaccharide flippase family protein [Ignavibacteriales bacterium]
MSLFRSTFLYTIGNIFSRSLSFLLLPLYSYLIPIGEFGNYSLIMSAYVILAAIYQGGLHAGFSKVYFEKSDEEYRKYIFSTLMNSILIFSLAISILLSFFTKEISSLILNNADRFDIILISIWMLFFDNLFYTVLHLLKSKEQAKRVIYYSSYSAIINLIFNIVLVFFLHHGIKGIFEAQLISGIFSLFIVLPVLKENYHFKIDNPLLKKILLFSAPLLLSGILSTLVDVADRFLLNNLMDKEAVGLYSFAYRIALIMNVFIISFRTAWTPYSLRVYKTEPKYAEYFGANLTKLIAISFLIFLFVSLLADDLFSAKVYHLSLLNPKYIGGIGIIPFIMLGYIFSGLVSYYSVYPYLSGKSYHFLISDGIAFVSNIVFNLLLIPVWHLTGAALATTLSFAFSFLYMMIVSKGIKTEFQKIEIASIVSLGVIFFFIGSYFNMFLVDVALLLSYFYLINSILKLNRISYRDVMK